MLLDSGCVVCGTYPGPVCIACADQLVAPATPDPIDGVDRCRVRYRLDDRARALIVALKYRRQRRLARWLAENSVQLVPRAADAITWVPATPDRRRRRGFDQAQELARELSSMSGVPLLATLGRSAGDARQTGQSRTGRLRGPSLMATMSPPPFVVLVDDVMTTGASLRSGATALRAAGSTRLVAVAIAATPGQETLFPHP